MALFSQLPRQESGAARAALELSFILQSILQLPLGFSARIAKPAQSPLARRQPLELAGKAAPFQLDLLIVIFDNTPQPLYAQLSPLDLPPPFAGIRGRTFR